MCTLRLIQKCPVGLSKALCTQVSFIQESVKVDESCYFVISAQNQADYLSRPDTTTAMLDTDAYRRGGLAWLSVQEHERFKVMLFPMNFIPK